LLFITAMLVIHDVFVDLNVAPDFNEMTKTYGEYSLQRLLFIWHKWFKPIQHCHRVGLFMTFTQFRFLV